MRQVRWLSWMGAVAAMVVFAGAGTAAAVSSDRAAAIVNFPVIAAGEFAESDPGQIEPGAAPQIAIEEIETLVQLSNVSDVPVYAHCFYENANAHCTNTGEICHPLDRSACCDDPAFGCGTCQPAWNEIDFWVRLTPRQPLGWLVSEGLSEFPIDGTVRVGVGGSSNSGSRIPPVPEDPFIGALKCIVVDETGTPTDQNVLKGEATFVEGGVDDGPALDVAKYNAVGIRAIEGAVNDDRELILGGPEPEYEGCPSVLILNHFFDGVVSPAAVEPDSPRVVTDLVLVPCQQDLLRQIPGRTVVQYLVYNEFEQRFSTSRTVDCQQTLPLSMIDTTQPERSIFSAGVAGTTTGQTRLSPLEGGLVGMAVELQGEQTSAFNLHFQGDRAEADVITLP